MLNKRPKHEKLPDYAVRFIGYSARIIAVKEMTGVRIWISFVEQQRSLSKKAWCLGPTAPLCLLPSPICRFALMN